MVTCSHIPNPALFNNYITEKVFGLLSLSADTMYSNQIQNQAYPENSLKAWYQKSSGLDGMAATTYSSVPNLSQM